MFLLFLLPYQARLGGSEYFYSLSLMLKSKFLSPAHTSASSDQAQNSAVVAVASLASDFTSMNGASRLFSALQFARESRRPYHRNQ